MAFKPFPPPEPKVLVGPPCRTCVRWHQSPSKPTIGYCGAGYGWQGPDDRPWNCEKHLPAGTLEANMIALDHALVWLRIGLEYYNGRNVGWPDDPRHSTATKKGELRREAEELQRRLKVLTDGL